MSNLDIFCLFFQETVISLRADIRTGSLENVKGPEVARVNASLGHLFLVFENYCGKVNTDRPIGLI